MLKKNRVRDLNNLEIPPELKLENEERRIQSATFDRVDLVIQFQSGKSNIGAIVKSFTDAITQHDLLVKEIEQQLLLIDEIKKMYRKKVRLFRNLDNAWNVIYTNPTEFTEYLELLPKMKNITKRLELVNDLDIKMKLQSQYNRFQLLEPTCSRQQLIYQLYQKARKEKDKITKEYIDAERILNEMKEKEIQLASLISDDHMMADEKGISLTELFPNIHIGTILTKINQYVVESLPYEEVIQCITRAKSPHKIEVKRYDYRYNFFEKKWYSLEELRSVGVFVENPMLRKIAFISAAAKGDIKILSQYIDEGEDPNSMDSTGNTPILTASVNRHIEAVELLQSKGANMNSRDKNYMTPLLYVINRGYMDLVRLLIAFGADKTAVDRNLHGCFYYAILSKHLPIVKMFFQRQHKNLKEKLWGFTPLHLAATVGDLPTIEFLLSEKCSIYQLDYNNKTAEEIAKESKHFHVAERLQEERIHACGQMIYYDQAKQFQLWIGDANCMEMEWLLDLEINCVIYFHQEEKVPFAYQWLLRQNDFHDKMQKILHPPEPVIGDGRNSTAVIAAAAGDSKHPSMIGGPEGKKKRGNLLPRKSKDHRTSTNNPALMGPAPPPTLSPQINRVHRDAMIMISPLAQKPSSPPSPTSELGDDSHLVVYNPSMIRDDEDLSDIDEAIPSSSRRGTTKKKKHSNFVHVKAPKPAASSSRRGTTHTVDSDSEDDEMDELLEIEEDPIQFYHFPIPIDSTDGDNHDQWAYLAQYIPQVMDIIPLYHLHQHEELLAKQTTYSTLQNSIEESVGSATRTSLMAKSIFTQSSGNSQKTRSVMMKKVLICDDSGNSLSPAMAAIYLLLKQSKRVQETVAHMKSCRATIEIGPTIQTGIQDLQYQYDDKVLKRMNAKLRGSVVTSIAF